MSKKVVNTSRASLDTFLLTQPDKLHSTQEQRETNGNTRLSANKMNSTLPIITTEPRKNHLWENFSVGRFIPFVSLFSSVLEPFICKNIPNSNFQPIARRFHGFTLIELVVTMAVAAILVSVAIPNMRSFIQNGRLNTQTNDLIGDISFARSEAIKRRVNVGLTTSVTGNCASGGNWRNGRVVFADTNANGACDASEILRYREPLSSATDTLTTTVLGDPIFFNANGQSPNFPPGVVLASFTFCDDRGPTKGKQVNLNSMGQVATRNIPPGGC